jgi:hypothetical protein
VNSEVSADFGRKESGKGDRFGGGCGDRQAIEEFDGVEGGEAEVEEEDVIGAIKRIYPRAICNRGILDCWCIELIAGTCEAVHYDVANIWLVIDK